MLNAAAWLASWVWITGKAVASWQKANITVVTTHSISSSHAKVVLDGRTNSDRRLRVWCRMAGVLAYARLYICRALKVHG